MDQFPRIQLFNAREKRAAAILLLASVALVATAVWYLHPLTLGGRRSAFAPNPNPRPQLQLTVAAASATTAYITILQQTRETRAVFRTQDGGRSWRPLSLPFGTTTAFSVAVIPGTDADVILTSFGQGLAYGTAPQYWLSRDRGEHWISLSLPNDGDPRGFLLSDSDHWYAMTSGSNGFHIHESNDEGATWRDMLTVPGPDPQLDGISLATGGVRVTFGSGATWLLAESISNGTATNWHLLRSLDDGSTWQQIALADPEKQNLQRAGISVPQLQADGRGCIVIYAASTGNAVRPRPDPYVSTTSDGGMTWSPWQLVKHNGYVQLLGANDWWATDGDVLYRSADFGVTWSSITPQLPAHAHLDLLFRATEQVAWNVYGNYDGTPVGPGIDRPHLLKTADGGRHWSEVQFPGL